MAVELKDTIMPMAIPACQRKPAARQIAKTAAEFQADQKEHHNHAELGEIHDALTFLADPLKDERAHNDAGNQVTEHRSHAETFCHQNRNNRRSQIHECVYKKSLTMHSLASYSAMMSSRS